MEKNIETKYIWYTHIASFLFFLSVNGQLPLLSPYATETLGASPSIVGGLFSITFIVAIIFRPFCGFIIDKGYKFEALMLGCLLAGLTSIGMYYSTDLWTFALCRVTQGIALAAFLPASISTALDMASEKHVGEVLGWRGTMFGISQVIGPSVGAYLGELLDFRTVFGITLFPFIAAFIIAYTTKKKITLPIMHETGNKVRKSDIVNANFIISLVATGLYSMAYNALLTFLPVFYVQRGLGVIVYGFYSGIAGGTGILARVVGGKQADIKGPLCIALIGVSIISVAHVGLYFFRYPPLVYLIAAIAGFGIGLWMPGVQLLGFQKTPPQLRGLCSSIYFISFDAGSLIGPMLFGYFIEAQGYTIMFLLAPLIFFMSQITILVGYFVNSHKANKPQK